MKRSINLFVLGILLALMVTITGNTTWQADSGYCMARVDSFIRTNAEGSMWVHQYVDNVLVYSSVYSLKGGGEYTTIFNSASIYIDPAFTDFVKIHVRAVVSSDPAVYYAENKVKCVDGTVTFPYKLYLPFIVK